MYVHRNRYNEKEQQETEVYHAALPLSSAVRTGLEPATPCVTGMYSNQLNYRTFLESVRFVFATECRCFPFASAKLQPIFDSTKYFSKNFSKIFKYFSRCRADEWLFQV